jgi:hypothetical protein
MSVETQKLKPVSQLVGQALDENTFTEIWYSRGHGQPGVNVHIRLADLQAFVKVASSRDTGYGYIREGQQTRITTLSIERNPGRGDLGCWDPQELINSPRHGFENQEKTDEDLSYFLNRIFEYFG